MYSRSWLYIFVLFVPCLRAQRYAQECVSWQKLGAMMEQEDTLEVACAVNSQCSGFDCRGNYSYSGVYNIFSDTTVECCFGIWMDPCSNPTALTVYMETFGEVKASFLKTVTDDETFQFQGASFSLAVGTADAFIAITMDPATVDGVQAVRLGMKLKVRVSVASTELWPDSMQVTLIPESEVPLPPCIPNIPLPAHTAGTCAQNTPGSVNVPFRARFPGTACQSGDLNGCRDGEMCVKTAGSGSNYVCVCMRDYVYSFGRQMCVKEQHIFNESIPYFDGEKTQPASATKGWKLPVVATVVAVLGVIVVVVIVGLVRKYKKHRSQYGQHELLLNNGDDDPALASDDAMITA